MPDHKVLEWPEELYGLEFLPSMWGEEILRFAPSFSKPPDLVVVHSGSVANWIAEYLNNPVCPLDHKAVSWDATKAADGCRLVDGTWYRVAAAHLCWYEGKTGKLKPGVTPPRHPNTFVQQASLRRSVPGAGGSVCQNRGGVNGRAIHIELPASPKDQALVRQAFRAVLSNLCDTLPSLRYWTTHKTIDPKHKSDPVKGTGFTARWMDGFGLEFAGR